MQVSVKFVFGQSNANALNCPLPDAEKITEPLKNVFCLPRVPNQSFDPCPVVWKEYTSFDENLGTTQGDTACLSTEYARLWQEASDEGEKLPPLYIVHLAIGAQGVTSKYMWYPEMERHLIPGPHGVGDISLFPLSCDVIGRVLNDLRSKGMEPAVSAIEWLGGEEEDGMPFEELDGVLPCIYRAIFDGWRTAAGYDLPIYLYHVRSYQQKIEMNNDLRSIEYINQTFVSMTKEYPEVYTVEPREYPGYEPDSLNNGMYLEDHVHYLPEVNRWLARKAFDRDLELLKSHKIQ